MMAVYSHVLEEVESLNRKYAPVSYMHTACLCNAIIALLKVPLSFQRYFFQKLQSTSIKVRQEEHFRFKNQLSGAGDMAC